MASITQKKPKAEEDRISSLSDNLLHQILSFLNTELVVRTCVLSKRWKNLWTCIPTLNLNYDSYSHHRKGRNSKHNSFENFILQLLSTRTNTWSIEKLTFSYPHADKILLKFLFYFASSQRVTELCIDTLSLDHSDYSCCLSTCRSLKIRGQCINGKWIPLISNTLISLEIVAVCFGTLGFEEELVSSCEKLTSLVIRGFNFTRVNISDPNLEYLGIYHQRRFLKHEKKDNLFPNIVLCTPKLSCVKFHNIIPVLKSVENFSFIDRFEITLDRNISDHAIEEEERAQQLSSLIHLLNAKSLVLSSNVAKVLSSLELGVEPKILENLRHLKLMVDNRRMSIPANVMSYLMKSPTLKTFVVELDLEEFVSKKNKNRKR